MFRRFTRIASPAQAAEPARVNEAARGDAGAPEGRDDELDISMLTEMGFEEEQARRVLEACSGNFEQALELLMSLGPEAGLEAAGAGAPGDHPAELQEPRQAPEAQRAASREDLEDLDAALSEAIRLSEEAELERQRNEEALQSELERERKELQEILEVSKNEHKMQEFERQRQKMNEQAQIDKLLLQSARQPPTADSSAAGSSSGAGGASEAATSASHGAAHQRRSQDRPLRLAPLPPGRPSPAREAAVARAPPEAALLARGGSHGSPRLPGGEPKVARGDPRPASRGRHLRAAAAMTLSG